MNREVGVWLLCWEVFPLETLNGFMDYNSRSAQSLIQVRHVQGGMAIDQSLIKGGFSCIELCNRYHIGFKTGLSSQEEARPKQLQP